MTTWPSLRPGRAACVLGLLTGACLPGAPPSSQLSEDAEFIGMRMEVIEPGPHSVDLLPIPADRTRSEALPGDRIRLEALAADVDGALDLDALEASWMITLGGLGLPSVAEHPPCDPSVPLGFSGCFAGTGASIELELPDLPSEWSLRQTPLVAVVVGVERSTEECLDLIADDISRISWDCLIATRALQLGPVVPLVELMLEQGIPLDPEGMLPDEIPELPVDIAPDFAPRTPWLTLWNPDGEVVRAWPDERTELPAGSWFYYVPAREFRDSQLFLQIRSDGVRIGEENVFRELHITGSVILDEVLEVPEQVGTSFTLFIVTTDSRQSQSWSIFDFDVVSP